VLSALLQDTACPAVLGAAASESAGDAVVTLGEVRLALRSLPSHRAPGEDGLTLELWRLADGAWVPVLARLYTAMFQLQRTPCRFTLGRISPLHNGGPMCQASNYCPITMLNSDCKVLARVFAERFGKVMPACIGVEQTAYLPGREIEDGDFHTQLVAANLSPTWAAWGSGPAGHSQGFRHHRLPSSSAVVEVLACADGFTYCSSTHQLPW
jgi:hypothetical protein